MEGEVNGKDVSKAAARRVTGVPCYQRGGKLHKNLALRWMIVIVMIAGCESEVRAGAGGVAGTGTWGLAGRGRRGNSTPLQWTRTP